MLTNLVLKLKQYVRENMVCCAICAASLLCGAVIGAVYAFSLEELMAKELVLYLGDFFVSFVRAGTDSAVIFSAALRTELLFFAVLFLCSGMIFGAPFLAILGVGSGFSVGFTVSFLLKSYGAEAILLVGGAMLPHAILLLPCHLAALCVGMRFSVEMMQMRTERKKAFLRHCFLLMILFSVAFAAILLQAYIEPLLVSLVAESFIG